jgi:hypothetical protein
MSEPAIATRPPARYVVSADLSREEYALVESLRASARCSVSDVLRRALWALVDASEREIRTPKRPLTDAHAPRWAPFREALRQLPMEFVLADFARAFPTVTVGRLRYVLTHLMRDGSVVQIFGGGGRHRPARYRRTR